MQTEEIAQYRELLEFSQLKGHSERVKETIKTALNKCEDQANLLLEKAAKDAEMREKAKTVQSPITHSGKTIKEITSFAWDQEGKKVTVYLSNLEGVGSVPKENITCNFSSHGFDLKIFGLNGANYGIVKENLEKEIDPSLSKLIVKPDKIRLVLMKKESSHWMDLCEKKKKLKTPKENKDDPTAGIMDLMKNLYEEGDDEMKRTIAKAWSENKEKKDSGLGFDKDMPSFDE